MSAPRPAVFLDRDGTLVSEREYLADPEAIELMPGAVDALRRLREAGFALVVVTNQSGIARGIYREEDFRAVTARLDEMLAAAGAPLDLTLHCPHHPDYTGRCSCRKPATGLHVRAGRTLGLDLAASYYVGDKLADVLPALALGGSGVLVRTGYGADHEAALPAGIEVSDDLASAAEWILQDASRRGSGDGAGGAAEP